VNPDDEKDDLIDQSDRIEAGPIAPVEPENPVAQAHRRHGIAGAILAGGMIAIDQIMGRKPKEQPAAVQEFSGEPEDIDTNGISIALDENTTVFSPAPHRRGTQPRTVRRRRRGRQGS
jgi:hypothetical protein